MRRAASPFSAGLLCALIVGASSIGALALPATAWAQKVAAAESGPKWNELSAAQRNALKPLERDWASIDADRKEKWLDIARRMPGMPPAERDRVQARMSEWARLSPQQRGQARLAYQQAKQVAPQDRQAQWEAYKALPDEQKRQLQARAVPPAPNGAGKSQTPKADKAPVSQAKSNIVPNPAYAAPPKPVAPTVIQAQPGATTSLISKKPTPPAHQQTGLPKIAATPEFVDKTTLLPRRGPQAAATRGPVVARSAAASAPDTRP